MTRNILSNLLKFLFVAIICYSMYSLFFTDFFSSKQDNNNYHNQFYQNDQRKSLSSYFSWESYWNDYYSNSFSGITKVRTRDVVGSSLNIKSSYARSWKELYKEMYLYDKNKLDLVYPMLNNIWRKYNIDRRQFLDIIVSFVQNIEYKLPDNEFGIYTPVEFMAYYKGDCDTRTVFLYTVLKKYNYDVVILDSEAYQHSMIGINISSNGKYKYYNGKRYYTWETTNTGWELGMIPPSSPNMNYWNIITL